MERIGEIINSQPSSTGAGLTIRNQEPPQQELAWQKLLDILAQDKRHDLAMAVRLLWKAKLKKYPDEEVCEALMLYKGEFFPKVDTIVELIERRRANVQTNKPWDKFKTERREAEAKGLLASTHDYEWLRSQFKKVAEGSKQVTSSGRTDGAEVGAGNDKLGMGQPASVGDQKA